MEPSVPGGSTLGKGSVGCIVAQYSLLQVTVAPNVCCGSGASHCTVRFGSLCEVKLAIGAGNCGTKCLLWLWCLTLHCKVWLTHKPANVHKVNIEIVTRGWLGQVR